MSTAESEAFVLHLESSGSDCGCEQDPHGEVQMLLTTLRDFLQSVRPEDAGASVLEGTG